MFISERWGGGSESPQDADAESDDAHGAPRLGWLRSSQRWSSTATRWPRRSKGRLWRRVTAKCRAATSRLRGLVVINWPRRRGHLMICGQVVQVDGNLVLVLPVHAMLILTRRLGRTETSATNAATIANAAVRSFFIVVSLIREGSPRPPTWLTGFTAATTNFYPSIWGANPAFAG